ncbi:MAG: hypothetical protein QNJ69_02955 [Gammaproteobacteria bacterium]|nr:hypothetical protein [Gammaproteobacteria bacterium]
MNKFVTASLAILMISASAGANELNDDAAYAIMQECMAGAEQSFNQNSGLDRYCIDSYLATTGQTN